MKRRRAEGLRLDRGRKARSADESLSDRRRVMGVAVMIIELEPEQLRKTCTWPKGLEFDCTENMELEEGIIGQERAVRAMEFGLDVTSPGYNIFVSGITGTGKTTYVRSIVNRVAAGRSVPPDWVYLYNFEDPNMPIAVSLPPGMGVKLQRDMTDLVEELKRRIPRTFESEEYNKQREATLRRFQEQSNMVLEAVSEKAARAGLGLVRTPTGFATIPVIDGRPLKQEEFEALDAEAKKAIEEKSAEMQSELSNLVRKLRDLEKQAKAKIKELDEQTGLYAVGHLIKELEERYKDYDKVVYYLEQVKHDIISNLGDFKQDKEESSTFPFPWLQKGDQLSPLVRYKVNVLVNNEKLQGAPVVFETNPTYSNLFGKVEYRGQFGVFVTDFTMIRAGAIHRANGGYLILNAQDVLKNPFAWDGLKRVLKTKEARIENLGEQVRVESTAGMQPEPIPINVKVIILGHPYIYRLLYHYDEDFKKLFKIKADFDVQMDRNEENLEKYARFVGSVCRRENLRHFDSQAVGKVIEYSSRLVEDQKKLSTRFNEIVEILYEASAWATRNGHQVVTRTDVEQAIEEKVYRSRMVEEKLQEMIARGKILVDAEGSVIGQVNGLTVYDLGDHSFGLPTRITARAYMGRSGIVNVERETEMSGRIHSKGVLILSGYLGAKYAQDKPLALSASLCFEQTYDEVDGDSASSTELYALLSALSGVPLRQDIAVTGSVNQKGGIQPVGGVTRKIEGFYDVCKIKGLTGKQGVIIPAQNVDNLMLREDVVEAVRSGMFHIYAITDIDDGIKLLTSMEAGQRDDEGRYPEGSVHYLVDQRLREWAEKMQEFTSQAEEGI